MIFTLRIKKKNNILLILELKNNIISDYTKIKIYASRETYYPYKILYFNGAVNEKTLLLDDIQNNNGYIYSKSMQMINNISKIETQMIVQEILFNFKFDDDFFNENRLKN